MAEIIGFIIIGIGALLLVSLFISLWWYESGMRAYSKGRGYYDGSVGGFRLNEESEGNPGQRKIAWIPTKTKHGWVWLDYIWRADKEHKEITV